MVDEVVDKDPEVLDDSASAGLVEPKEPKADLKREDEPSAKELKRQNELLQNELDLQRRKFEHELERALAPPATTPKVEDELEFDLDLLAATAENDRKGFGKALGKFFEQQLKAKGYVSREDAEKLVDSKAAEYVEDQRTLDKYPDLTNAKSDLYKQADEELSRILKDPEEAGLSRAKRIRLAADRAALALIEQGKKIESETSRQARIRAQQGDPGSRTSREQSSELDAEQKHIAAAFGISEEAYAKRAGSGGIKLGRGGR